MRGVSSKRPAVGLTVGDAAPDFDLVALMSGVKKDFLLREHSAQKHLVLAFYPLNWDSVSARQLVEYQAEREQFLRWNAEVVAISVDSIMNTTVWEREIGPFDYALGSDFWPHGEVSRAYGVFCEGGPHAGTSQRAVFIVERGGRIAFCSVYDRHELPPISQTLEALSRL